MTDVHTCFDTLVETTGYDATFVKPWGFRPMKDGLKVIEEWRIALYKYTPSLRISETRSLLKMNYCPMCGIKLVEEE